MVAKLESTATTVLAVYHLMQVEIDLLEAKRTMRHRLQSLVSRLPAGDPDRQVLAACIDDLTRSIRQQQTLVHVGAISRPRGISPLSASRKPRWEGKGHRV